MWVDNRAASAVAEVAVAALSTPSGTAALMQGVLEAVRTAIGADTAGFFEHQYQGFSLPLFLSPADVWQRIPYARIPTTLAASVHPGVQHLVTNRPGKPFLLTDVVSERVWWNSELGTSMRPDWGRNYQFAIPVPATNRARTCWVWVLGRETRDFSSTDRETAAALQPVLCVIARQHALPARHPRAGDADTCGLTQRELVVLDLLSEGLNANSAGYLLGISPRTAHKHIERIYRKLSVNDRHQALRAARQHGIL